MICFSLEIIFSQVGLVFCQLFSPHLDSADMFFFFCLFRFVMSQNADV